MIELKNIYKTYHSGKSNEFTALKDATLTIEDGEMVAVIGKSGAGKSTLMHILGCIDDFDKGEYFLNGEDISKVSEKRRAVIRNKEVGIVLQDFALVESYSVAENVMLPLYFSKHTGNRKARGQKAMEILKQMEMDQMADKKVNKLSGGQKQRVAIARAIAAAPPLILADEPTGNLDSKSTKDIMQILDELNEQGNTIVLITHDDGIATNAKRVVRIMDGKIESDTTKTDGEESVVKEGAQNRNQMPDEPEVIEVELSQVIGVMEDGE